MPPPRPAGYVPFPPCVLRRFAAACTEHWVGILCESSPEDSDRRVEHIPATRSPAPSGLPVEEEVVYRAAGLMDALAIKDVYRQTRKEFLDDLERSDPKPGPQVVSFSSVVSSVFP